MKRNIIIFLLSITIGLFGCHKDEKQIHISLDSIKTGEYYNTEIFTQPYLKIYGKWKLFASSGGYAGIGTDLNFEFFEVRKYGVYGFIQNEKLLEYGKMTIAPQLNDNRLKVFFEKGKYSDLFMRDNEKYIYFYGNDTMYLSSPCCDRINYHLVRED